MKKIIIILGTVLLAVWMVSTLIMGGGTDSFQGQSNAIVNKSKAQIDEIVK